MALPPKFPARTLRIGIARIPFPTHGRATVPIFILLVILIGLVVNSRGTEAHAFLKSSTPAANAIVATVPSSVTLTFTEPLERASSKASLFDQTGKEVPGASYRAGSDEFTMILDLPAGLANGTYTVAWETLSAADGHTAQGYVPFTIGTQANVVTAIPPVLSSAGGPPLWLSGLARWTALLGLAAAIAVWPNWLLVLRPAISPAWQAGPALTHQVKGVAAGAIIFALLGSLFALLVQASSFNGDDGYFGDLRSTVLDTRYGRFWLIRVGLLMVLGAVLTMTGWWWPRRTRFLTLSAAALSVALPIPYSEIAHAAAQPRGKTTAVAFDVAHLLGAGMWVGGLIILVLGLLPTLRDLTPAGRRVVLSRAIPRFSAVALVAWAVLGFSGLYSAWLNVGNLDGLRETAYGRSLTLKLILLAPLLVLGAFNLLVVTRKIRGAGRDTKQVLAWSRHFAIAILIEVVLVTVVLLVVGRLTGQAPAREELALENGRATMRLSGNGLSATLAIAPAATGPNHYRLEVDGATLPTDARAILRIELPSQGAGQTDINLVRAAGNAFEAHGSELSIAGDWTIQTIIIRPGQDDWTASKTLSVGLTPPQVDLPSPAWSFGPAGVFGLALIILGAAGFAVAWLTGRTPLRRESAGLGTVAMAAGVILLLQARLGPAGATLGSVSANPIAADTASITRGQSIYSAQCLACHGPGGKGDGPQAAGLNPPPADFTLPHIQTHLDQDLYFWVQNGIQGTAMPAFAGTLNDQQTWDVINYIRSIQAQHPRDAPGPDECTVAPRTIDSLRALADPDLATQSTIAPGAATPLLPSGTPASQDVISGISATVRELIACSNARDPLRRLALFSDGNLRPTFARGPSQAFINAASTPAVPLPDNVRVAIVSITDVQVLPDGRVKATVSVDNPTTHSHGPQGQELPGQQTLEVATLVFVQQDGVWLIDEMR